MTAYCMYVFTYILGLGGKRDNKSVNAHFFLTPLTACTALNTINAGTGLLRAAALVSH